MKNEDLLAGAAAALGLALTSAMTWGWCSSRWRDEAVAIGHAEYYLDANHDRQWRWRTNTTCWVHVEQATNGNFIVTFPEPSHQSVTINKP